MRGVCSDSADLRAAGVFRARGVVCVPNEAQAPAGGTAIRAQGGTLVMYEREAMYEDATAVLACHMLASWKVSAGAAAAAWNHCSRM